MEKDKKTEEKFTGMHRLVQRSVEYFLANKIPGNTVREVSIYSTEGINPYEDISRYEREFHIRIRRS